MAIKILKDIKINGFRVIFGSVNNEYMIAIPDISVSTYLNEFTEENKHDNIITLTEAFKRTGYRNSVFAYLVITEATRAWLGGGFGREN